MFDLPRLGQMTVFARIRVFCRDSDLLVGWVLVAPAINAAQIIAGLFNAEL